MAVIAEIGPVENDPSATSSTQTDADSAAFTSAPNHAGPRRRLYRLTDGAMLAGVCNGLAAYLGLDVTLVRLAVAALIFLSAGTVIIAYLVAVLIVPKAVTPAQKAAASGATDTANDFIRMARAGYYEGMRKITDPQARREWKRKFKREMRDWKDKFQGK
jgi:phage shock protein PspC (stress-responsive transcriptional regulator)